MWKLTSILYSTASAIIVTSLLFITMYFSNYISNNILFFSYISKHIYHDRYYICHILLEAK